MNIATHDAFQDRYRGLLAAAAQNENARLAEVLGCDLIAARERCGVGAALQIPAEVFISAVASCADAGGATVSDVCAAVPDLERNTVARRLRNLWRAEALDRKRTGKTIIYSLPRRTGAGQ